MVILQFLVVAVAFAAIDAVWPQLMNPFYRSHIGEVPADKPHLGYAVAHWLIDTPGSRLPWAALAFQVDRLRNWFHLPTLVTAECSQESTPAGHQPLA
ncbi:DUF2177 family protein [Pseudarthrobacter sp. YALA5]|uniref:DUF2177 family protein n=1 Tax=Pseudarthrobacter sp. DSP2-3-2b1 TaxID=2804661 RepID=UPI0010386673